MDEGVLLGKANQVASPAYVSMPSIPTCAQPSLHLQEELGYLKSMWDAVAAVLHTFQAWSGMRWGSINVESLQEVRS